MSVDILTTVDYIVNTVIYKYNERKAAMHDKDTQDDITRDLSDQDSLKKSNTKSAIEEQLNSIQLKYEAMLADPAMLMEAAGPDGIQYPDHVFDQEAYDNCMYYPSLGHHVLRATKDKPSDNLDLNDTETLLAVITVGKMLIEQIGKYLHPLAVDQVEGNY